MISVLQRQFADGPEQANILQNIVRLQPHGYRYSAIAFVININNDNIEIDIDCQPSQRLGQRQASTTRAPRVT